MNSFCLTMHGIIAQKRKYEWLVTGDLYLATRPKLFRADESLDDEIKSLEKLLSFDFKTLFCAHKGVVPDGYEVLREKLEYLKELACRVKKLYDESISVKDITVSFFGKKDTTGLLSFRHICFENLTKECLRVDEGLLV